MDHKSRYAPAESIDRPIAQLLCAARFGKAGTRASPERTGPVGSGRAAQCTCRQLQRRDPRALPERTLCPPPRLSTLDLPQDSSRATSHRPAVSVATACASDDEKPCPEPESSSLDRADIHFLPARSGCWKLVPVAGCLRNLL